MKPFKCNNLDLNESEGVELNLTEFKIDGLSGVVVGLDVDEQTLQAYIGPNDIARMKEWLADWSRLEPRVAMQGKSPSDTIEACFNRGELGKNLRASVIDALKRKGVITFEDLGKKSEIDVLDIPDLGERHLERMGLALERRGLSWSKYEGHDFLADPCMAIHARANESQGECSQEGVELLTLVMSWHLRVTYQQARKYVDPHQADPSWGRLAASIVKSHNERAEAAAPDA